MSGYYHAHALMSRGWCWIYFYIYVIYKSWLLGVLVEYQHATMLHPIIVCGCAIIIFAMLGQFLGSAGKEVLH